MFGRHEDTFGHELLKCFVFIHQLHVVVLEGLEQFQQFDGEPVERGVSLGFAAAGAVGPFVVLAETLRAEHVLALERGQLDGLPGAQVALETVFQAGVNLLRPLFNLLAPNVKQVQRLFILLDLLEVELSVVVVYTVLKSIVLSVQFVKL